MTHALKFAIAAILIGSIVSSCVGASTRFYTLDAAASEGAGAIAYSGPAFRIDAVHIPAVWDRPELVRETSANQFIVSDTDHWAGPLGELLRRVITQDLAAKLPPGKVIYPDAPKPEGSIGVVVDILAMTPSRDSILMDVSWTALSPSAKPNQASMPTVQQHAVRLITPAGQGVSADAQELSALADQLASAIAASLASSAA